MAILPPMPGRNLLPKQPPLDGSLDVLPGFIDFHAEHNPDLPWVLLAPQSTEEPTPIPFIEFSNATHRVAYAVKRDPNASAPEVVALLLHCDTVLYLAVLAGVVRAGLIPFPMSPKNSVAAIANLLEKTSCHRVISQTILEPLMATVKSDLMKKNYLVEVDCLPELHSIFPDLEGGITKVAPYPKIHGPNGPNDIILILHSSGSTGLPKPVPQRRCDVLDWCGQHILLETRERGIVWGSMALPTFHTIGMFMQFYCPLSSGYPVALYRPKAPEVPVFPTPQNMLEACKASGVSGIPIVPAFIEAWAQNDEDVAYLISLQGVLYGGGPLSQTNGDKLVKAGVNLFSVYGGTEFGVHTRVFDAEPSAGPSSDVKSKEDWAWVTFQNHVCPHWVPQGDGTYELQILSCKTHSPALTNLPDMSGYATGDLFVPHPRKQGLWRIVGRRDDVLVLGSGEKVVPLPQEGSITASSMVSGAVVFGIGKSQCGVLIEPSPQFAVDPNDARALIEFTNEIWPLIDETNGNAPTFARIYKDMILITDPARPLPRSPKGTVIRKQTYTLYADEIENLYNSVAQNISSNAIDPPATWSVEDIGKWLVQHSASSYKDKIISPIVDIFDQGFDSVRAALLRNRIIRALRSSEDPAVRQAVNGVTQTIVYDHSTLSELAVAIAALVGSTATNVEKYRSNLVYGLIDKYSAGIAAPSHSDDVRPTSDIVVLLTGSTGRVGSHVLTALLAEEKVTKVYTLNRRAVRAVDDRQRATFGELGLSIKLLDECRIVRRVGDLTREDLGLSGAELSEMKASVTHVIHCAWRLDFYRALSSFDSSIAGTRRLIDFCTTSARGANLLFTSSISAAQNWHISNGPVPEEPLHNPVHAAHSGYGASKFVAENILERATAAGVSCTILRIGQTSGAATGLWTASQWVSAMLKSSRAFAALPSLDSDVFWVPIDGVTTGIVDLVLSDKPLPLLLNMVHPRPLPWNAIISAFNESLTNKLPVVPYAEWLVKLENAAVRPTEDDLDAIPAIALLPLFRSIPSATLRAAKYTAVQKGNESFFDTAKLNENCGSVAFGDADNQQWNETISDLRTANSPEPASEEA